MAEKEIAINGVHSGDCECWCFLVDKETFTRVRGEAPNEECDVGRYAAEGSPYRYMLYPGDIFAGARYDDPEGAVCTMYVKSLYPETTKGESK